MNEGTQSDTNLSRRFSLSYTGRLTRIYSSSTMVEHPLRWAEDQSDRFTRRIAQAWPPKGLFVSSHMENVCHRCSPFLAGSYVYSSSSVLPSTSTFTTRLQGIITCPTNRPSSMLGVAGPGRNSCVLTSKMFRALSVPTSVPRKMRPS
jgi:hypothetical protein